MDNNQPYVNPPVNEPNMENNNPMPHYHGGDDNMIAIPEGIVIATETKPLPQSPKGWFNYGVGCFTGVILGLLSGIPALLGESSPFAYFIPMLILAISCVIGIIALVRHKKYHERKSNLVMACIGLGLIVGWPFLFLVGLFIFMSIGLILFS